jgi:hypothetical protein
MAQKIYVVNSYGNNNGVYYHDTTMAFTTRNYALSFAKGEVALNEDEFALDGKGKHYETIHDDVNHWFIFEVGNDKNNHHIVEIVECVLCDRKI